MPPIRNGDGTPVAPKGVSQVRTGDGRILFDGPAIPDSVEYQLNAFDIDADEGDTLAEWPEAVTGGTVGAVGEPTYRESDVNGHPSVELDGSNDGFVDNNFSNIDPPYTIIALMLSNVTDNGYITGRIDEEIPYMEIRPDNEGIEFRPGADTISGGSYTEGEPVIVSGRAEDGDSVLRVDGSEVDSGINDPATIEMISLGFEPQNDRRYLDGNAMLLEVHDRGLSDSEISDREDVIAGKWDVTI